MINSFIIKTNNLLYDKYLFFIIFLGLFISILKINFLPFSLPIDSYGYLEYADNLLTKNDWQSRPIGYPIFLKLTRIISPFGYIFVIFFQLIIYITSAALLYFSFRNFNKIISFIFSVIFLLTPAFQWINYNIVADAIYSFMPIFVIFFLYKYSLTAKNTNFFLFFLFALLVTLLRPTYIVFFYFILLISIVFYFFNTTSINFKINKKFLLKILTLTLISLFIYNNLGSKFSKNYGVHQLWIWNISTTMCGDKKCFNISNGKYARAYFDVVPKLINKNENFKKILSSNYDYKDSAESINEDLYKLSSKTLLNTIHLSENHTPFVHIYGFMVNEIGFEKTHQIIRNLSIETFIKNPIIILNNFKHIYSIEFILNTKIKKSSQVFKEGMYFAILPKPYKNLNDQGMNFFKKITDKEYAQILFSLENFTGETFLNFNKNKEKYHNLHKKLDNLDFVKNAKQNENNIAFILFYFLGIINLYFLIFYKLFILFLIPVYSIVFLFNTFIKREYNIESFIYFLSITIFYSIFIISSIVAPMDVDRVINLNISILLPALIIFMLQMFKSLKKIL